MYVSLHSLIESKFSPPLTGIAYPILQCAILFSGIWGVFVFKEIIGNNVIITFFGGGAILLTGAVMLAVAQ